MDCLIANSVDMLSPGDFIIQLQITNWGIVEAGLRVKGDLQQSFLNSSSVHPDQYFMLSYNSMNIALIFCKSIIKLHIVRDSNIGSFKLYISEWSQNRWYYKCSEL